MTRCFDPTGAIGPANDQTNAPAPPEPMRGEELQTTNRDRREIDHRQIVMTALVSLIFLLDIRYSLARDVNEAPLDAEVMIPPCKTLKYHTDSNFKQADVVISGHTTNVLASGVFRTLYKGDDDKYILYRSNTRFQKLKRGQFIMYSYFNNVSVVIDRIYKGAELLQGINNFVVGLTQNCAPCKQAVTKVGPIDPPQYGIYVIQKHPNRDDSLIKFINYGLPDTSKESV